MIISENFEGRRSETSSGFILNDSDNNISNFSICCGSCTFRINPETLSHVLNNIKGLTLDQKILFWLVTG